MAEQETKSSDAVRMTRIIAPTVLIITLAIIFKSEIGGSMKRGCFEISIEQAGLDFSDQSLCSVNDVNDFANNMTQAGATVAEQQADSAFSEFEAALNKLIAENGELQNVNADLASADYAMSDKLFDYANKLEEIAEQGRSPEEKEFMREFALDFRSTFDVPPIRLEEESSSIETSEPVVVEDIAEGIRSRYIQRAQTNVKAIQSNVNVQQKK